MSRLRISGGLVVTPGGTDRLDVLVRDERIEALVAPGVDVAADAEIDAGGLVVLPGAIDGHTHFIQDDVDAFEPDPDEYEGFENGGRGAAAGGVTTVVEMPQGRPPTTDGERFRRKRELALRDAVVDFALWGGAVQGQPPSAITEQLEEGAVGIKAFMCDSDPTYPGIDDAQLVQTLEVLLQTPFMLGLHAENDALLRAGEAAMRAAGRRDPLAHADSRPAVVEIEAVARAILFAEHTGAWVHIVHLSTAGAAERVAAARARGVRVTCETCPQYLTLDNHDLERLGPFARCAPPIRSREDVEALWAHLAAGTIDCITTDHCAFTAESKRRGADDIFAAPNGLPGIQCVVPLVITEGRRRGWAWADLARVLSSAPARLWRLAPRKGAIQPGADADLMLLDPDRRWTIHGADLHHTHRWTPYEDVEATGRVVRTLVRGETVFEDRPEGAVFAPAGSGRFVPAQVPAAVPA